MINSRLVTKRVAWIILGTILREGILYPEFISPGERPHNNTIFIVYLKGNVWHNLPSIPYREGVCLGVRVCVCSFTWQLLLW